MSTRIDRLRSDFNHIGAGDGGAFGDIFWRTDAGHNAIFLMFEGTAITVAAMPFVSPDWHYLGATDFDATGQLSADILWQNTNGSLALWQMNGTTVSNIIALPNVGPTWHAVAQNDFTANNASDILFRNDSGALAMWAFTSATAAPTVFTTSQNPQLGWDVVGTGDTGRTSANAAGVLWQHDNGDLVLWEDPIFAVGTFVFDKTVGLGSVGATWHVKGMGDLNGDGNGAADIVFQHDSGAVVVWEMGGVGFPIVVGQSLASLNPGPSWHVVGIRDMSGDGKADILFQHDSGTAALWENYTSGGGVANFTVLAITPNPNPSGLVWDLL